MLNSRCAVIHAEWLVFWHIGVASSITIWVHPKCSRRPSLTSHFRPIYFLWQSLPQLFVRVLPRPLSLLSPERELARGWQFHPSLDLWPGDRGELSLLVLLRKAMPQGAPSGVAACLITGSSVAFDCLFPGVFARFSVGPGISGYGRPHFSRPVCTQFARFRCKFQLKLLNGPAPQWY